MREVILPAPLSSMLGRLESKAITNFFGEPGTGKTNVCLLAALSCAERGGIVTYIDTEGGFSVERLKQLCPTKWDTILRRIELMEPKDFKEQDTCIKSIAGKRTDLVILDSAVALYRLEYSESKPKIQSPKNRGISDEVLRASRKLSKQISILSNLAREKGIPVIITAHTFRNWGTGKMEIVGGDTLKYWSKAIISIEKTNRTSERKATLLKHRSLPEGGTAKFMITQNGIKPSGFKIF